ncbi:hypothetical protein NDU88_001580 [Pleurodeles waltl]|uniref:Uncharacterized protein n=1 Tax=Pleurodeles waltl TaxID=8319 RepID=A0AAV7LHT9_PLEWA|nr:hypothetical protein NDU88_001580 [Pleurodeles waltl]
MGREDGYGAMPRCLSGVKQMFLLSASPPPLRVLRDRGCSLFGAHSSSGARRGRSFLLGPARHRAKRQGARRLSPSVPAAEAAPSDRRGPPNAGLPGLVHVSRLSPALGAASPLHQLVRSEFVQAPRVHTEPQPERLRAAPRPRAAPDQAAPTGTLSSLRFPGVYSAQTGSMVPGEGPESRAGEVFS